MNERRGFTLVELLVVIAIVGILGVGGTLGVQGLLDRGRLSEAINVVASDVEQARRLAKRLDRPVTFAIDQVDGEWRSIVDGTPRTLGAEVVSGPVSFSLAPPFGTYGGADVVIDLAVRGSEASVAVTGVLARTVVQR